MSDSSVEVFQSKAQEGVGIYFSPRQDVVHSESVGISNGEETAGTQTDLNDHIGQQPCNQAYVDLLPHRGAQLAPSCI